MYLITRCWPKMAANTRVIIAEDELEVTSQSKNRSMDKAGNRSKHQVPSDCHRHRLLLSMGWGASFFAPSAFSAFAVGAPHPWAVCRAEIEQEEQSLAVSGFLLLRWQLPKGIKECVLLCTSRHFGIAVGASLHLLMNSYDGKRAKPYLPCH